MIRVIEGNTNPVWTEGYDAACEHWHERFVHVDQKRMAAEARVAELEAALDRIAYFRYGNETTAGEIARDVLKGADPDIVPVRATPVDEKGKDAD